MGTYNSLFSRSVVPLIMASRLDAFFADMRNQIYTECVATHLIDGGCRWQKGTTREILQRDD